MRVETNKIYCGNALEVLRSFPDGCVQCVVTSPPYDDLRTYGGYFWEFEGIAQELYRVLCDGGVLCWNVGDSTVDGSETLTSAKQKIFFREKVGFRIHDTMIYQKANFSHPEKVRYHQVFEYVFILSKGAPRTFNPIKDKPNAWAGRTVLGRNVMRQASGEMKEGKKNIIVENGMRGNVWYGLTAGQENVCGKFEHPAMMPEWLAGDLIASWSNQGDIVLDPMTGSGTTCLMANRLNRAFVGIELNPEYVNYAQHRLTPEVKQAKMAF